MSRPERPTHSISRPGGLGGLPVRITTRLRRANLSLDRLESVLPISDRAGLPDDIDGAAPAPKLGRRFWYDAYASSLDVVLDSLDETAAEQGNANAEVVLQNYLSDARARKLRREYM